MPNKTNKNNNKNTKNKNKNKNRRTKNQRNNTRRLRIRKPLNNTNNLFVSPTSPNYTPTSVINSNSNAEFYILSPPGINNNANMTPKTKKVMNTLGKNRMTMLQRAESYEGEENSSLENFEKALKEATRGLETP